MVAATPFLSALGDPERVWGLARPAGAQSSPVALPINLELVTLTETSAILTWFTGDPTRVDELGRLAPVPTDTAVLLGTAAGGLRQVFHDPEPTPYHYVELTDLEPGQPYFYTALSGGVPALPALSAQGNPLGTSTVQATAAPPYVFRTPEPPPGRYLFSVALCNDLHLGETVAGLATTINGIEVPPGISQVPGRPPYPEIMSAALAREARARGADLLLAGGDISAEASAADVGRAKAHLDAFGPQGQAYLVARGNHDRPHTGGEHRRCSPVRGAPGYHDCFRDVFFADQRTWFAHEAFGMRVIGLDTYDKIGTGGDNGVLSDGQFAFVRRELAADRDRPTLVFGHHPITLESGLTGVLPLNVTIQREQAAELGRLYAASPGVFLHHAGHTHRNKRTVSLDAPGVVFQEVAAVKEYPGGFHLLRVFSGGYALNFYKFRDTLAQEWSERSRPEYLGLAPFYLFGNTSDRNTVVPRDLSGLRSAEAAAGPTTTAVAPATDVEGELADTGGGASTTTAAAVGAAAALTAAIGAEEWLRRTR